MRAALAFALVTLASLALELPHDALDPSPHVSALPKIAPAPEFSLTSQDGTQVNLGDLRGKVVAVTFIYTTCTSTCPVLTPTLSFVQDRLGRTPTLIRPPFGHLGGSTVLAADSLGYDVILWDRQMRERRYDPAAQARDIVGTVRPGSIVLAHDAGDARRLVALAALKDIIAGLKDRGFEFVTVSDLIRKAAEPPPVSH